MQGSHTERGPGEPLVSRGLALSSRVTRAVRLWSHDPCRAAVRHVERTQRANRFSRSEFSTTNTELNAMAAPAIMGFNNPRAATGMATVL